MMPRRHCDNCQEPMTEGFCIFGGEHYLCDEECLKSWYSPKEIKNLGIGEDDSDSYWTTWEDEDE